jgi:hypothetical protein
MTKTLCRIVLLLALAAVPRLHAQTGAARVTGRATLEGKGVSGVTVTLTARVLQRARVVTTGIDGEFHAPALPPGTYSIRFELAGLQPATRDVHVAAAGTARVDVELRPAPLVDAVTVEPHPFIDVASPESTTNLSAEVVEVLPGGRTILDAVLLAPGVRNSGPNRLPIINGAPSYDNLYLVDGVTINDQTRGQPHKLFIEDAIQETTVLTAGISAEYGRFTGGVVNVVTRSGGNDPTGSLRDSLSSDRWKARTPFANEPAHLRNVNNDYEATLGGRILRDRLWFFLAGRYGRRDDAQATQGSGIPFTRTTTDTRMEAKLTAALSARHTLVGSFVGVHQRDENLSVNGTAADLESLFDNTSPSSLLALYYTGIARQDTVLEAQFSRKQFAIRGGAGSSVAPGDLVHGTPVFGLANGWTAAAPAFCGACGATRRDNRDLLVKASWFRTTERFGDHTVVAGIDDFHELRDENLHQSASDFFIDADIVTFDEQNYVQAVPGQTYLEYLPILFPGDRPADFATRSAFVNDHAIAGQHFAFNLGLRYDANRGHDSRGASQARDSRFSPRLGATWDLRGDGTERINATFSRYASKVQQTIGGATSPAGVPANLLFFYEGPEINVDPSRLVPAREAVRQIFEWFQSVGGVRNDTLLAGGSLPGQTLIRGQLAAPIMDETTLGYGHQFSSRGLVRADYIQRRWSDFYVSELTTANGTITQPDGTTLDRILVSNGNEGLSRRYRALAVQGGYRFAQRMTAGGNYTWSRLTGNVEGENSVNEAVATQSPTRYQPEYRAFAENAPVGYLSGDIRHHLNFWASYEVPSRHGRFVATLLERYQSPRSYSAAPAIDVHTIRNPGYSIAPASVPYYLFGRGTLRTDAVSSTGLGLNYGTMWRGLQFLAEADLDNVFNEQAVEDPAFVDRTVATSRVDRNLVAFNPFTTQPVACPRATLTSSAQCKGVTHYQLGRNFGLATNQRAYQQPRTLRVSFGVRF